MQNFNYFKASETGFVLFSTKQKMSLAFCVILLILGIVFNFYYSNSVLGEYAILYRIMAIDVPLIWIYGTSLKIEIDTTNKSLIASNFFEILKKKL